MLVEQREMDRKQLGQRNRHAVLVPCPFQGHITPMLQLATILHFHGFSITILHTEFNSPDPSSHPQLDFQSIPDSLSNTELGSANFVLIISVLNENCRGPFRESLVRMMQQDESSCIIIYDELMYFAGEVAKLLNVPCAALRTVSAATGIARAAILQLKTEGYIPLKDSMLSEQVPQLPSLRFQDLPVSKFGTPESFLQLVAHSLDMKTPSAVIWNTVDCLEHSLLAQLQQQCPVQMFAVGPLHKLAPAISTSLLSEDRSCIAWLDKQAVNSVLYISLGSVASVDGTEVEEMAWGIANSKQPFLWVVRPGSILGSQWINLLPEGFTETIRERGCIVKWVPQKEVLAHPAVGGFWSHCGWNSTLESISEGVPMICRPSFGDQRVTARYVSHVWGIGLHLEKKLKHKDVERAIRTVMVDKEGGEIRQKAKDLQGEVELCINKGGHSYNSMDKLIELLFSL